MAAIALSAQAQSTIRFVHQSDLKATDPVWSSSAITLIHGYMIYDQLFATDEELRIRPQMVESWSVSEDGRSYTFTLRPDLTFHDGDPVTSEDCVASIRRWGARDTMGQRLLALTDALEVVDARTFRFRLSQPYALLGDSFGKLDGNALFIMKAELAAYTDPHTPVEANIGSGPFKMAEAEWERGRRVVYVKNDDYVPRSEPPSWYAGGKVARVDRVEWTYLPDHEAALRALQRGEVDYIEKPLLSLLHLVEEDSDISVAQIPLIYQGWLQINHLHAPFDNVKARRALLYLVDQQEYMEAMIGRQELYMSFCGAVFLCGMPYESEEGAESLREHSPEKAKRLLLEAGYAGQPIVIMDPVDYPVLHSATTVTIRKLREIGVNVEPQPMDWSTLTARRTEKTHPRDGGWHIFHTWWSSGSLTLPVSHPGVSGACDQGWYGWPCDEALQELNLAWARESDPDERKLIAGRLQQRVFEVVPYVPLGQWNRPLVYRRELRGLLITPYPVFWNVSKPEG